MKKKILFVLALVISCLCYSQDTNSIILKLKTEYWVPTFYNDVLQAQNRETYYKYAPYYKENPETWVDYKDAFYPWYEYDWYPEVISFSNDNKGLMIARHAYLIAKTEKNKMVLEISEKQMIRNFELDQYVNFDWNLLNNKKKFTLIFEFDGDYVDIYVNDKKHLFATFCKYKGGTYQALIDTIKNNGTEDTWMIEYPKRANGSIDFVSSK